MEALKIVQVYALYWKRFDHNFGQNSLSSFLICTMPQKDFDHCQMEFIFDSQSSSHKQDKKNSQSSLYWKQWLGPVFVHVLNVEKKFPDFDLR